MSNVPRSPRALPPEMGRYKPLRTVGAGSFGAAILVTRGQDQFIAKEMNIGKMSPIERESVDSEVKILSELTHPNIVRYEECVACGPVLYIIMEFANGGDLYQKISSLKEPMTEEDALYIFTQICMAVKHLHSRRILHRDLKSQNVFLTKDNVVKLGDFGLATALRHTWQQAHSLCGTPNYFSPELVAGRPYNNKTDIWAMGCILYELVTRRWAFCGATLPEIMHNIQTEQPAPISGNYSDSLKSLLSRMLCKEQAIRPSIDALMRANILKNALQRIQTLLQQPTSGFNTTVHNTPPAQPAAPPVEEAPPEPEPSPELPPTKPPLTSHLSQPQLNHNIDLEHDLAELEKEILSDHLKHTKANLLAEVCKTLHTPEVPEKESEEVFGDDLYDQSGSSPPSGGVGATGSLRSAYTRPGLPSSRGTELLERQDSLGGEIEGLLQQLDTAIKT